MRLRLCLLAELRILALCLTAASFATLASVPPSATASRVAYAPTGGIVVTGDAAGNRFEVWESVVQNNARAVTDLPFAALLAGAPKITPEVKQVLDYVNALLEQAKSAGEAEASSSLDPLLAGWLLILASIAIPTNEEYEMDRVILVRDDSQSPLWGVPPCRPVRFLGGVFPGTRGGAVQCPLRAGDRPELHVFGGDGEDVVKLNLKLEWLSKQLVNGGGDHDELFGSESADVLIGGAGSDRLEGYGGVDWLMSDRDGEVDAVNCGGPRASTAPSEPNRGDLADIDFSEARRIQGCEDIAMPRLPELGP